MKTNKRKTKAWFSINWIRHYLECLTEKRRVTLLKSYNLGRKAQMVLDF